MRALLRRMPTAQPLRAAMWLCWVPTNALLGGLAFDTSETRRGMFPYWPLQLDFPSRSERNHESSEHFSKSHSWATSLSDPWEPVRNAHSSASPQTY